MFSEFWFISSKLFLNASDAIQASNTLILGKQIDPYDKPIKVSISLS